MFCDIWFSNISSLFFSIFFFFNDTATTEIYTLSLHDALPICCFVQRQRGSNHIGEIGGEATDRKSTRLNSSHANISYAVFCLKKKKIQHKIFVISAQKLNKKTICQNKLKN